jgi:hypothetical protein
MGGAYAHNQHIDIRSSAGGQDGGCEVNVEESPKTTTVLLRKMWKKI